MPRTRKHTAPRRQISASLKETNFNTIDEYRWSVRKTMPEMLDEIVEFYIAENGLVVVESAPVVSETETASKKS